MTHDRHRTPTLALAGLFASACASVPPTYPGHPTLGHCGLESVSVKALGME